MLLRADLRPLDDFDVSLRNVLKKVFDLVECSRSTLALSSSCDEKVFIFMSVGKSHGLLIAREKISVNCRFFILPSSSLSSSCASILFYVDILKLF